MSAPLTTYRFTVDDYHRMAEAGVFHEDDRVELLDGEIIVMAPIGSRHAATVARLTHLFGQRLGDRAIVWVQNPVQLDRFTEPEPDLCLLRCTEPAPDGYRRVRSVGRGATLAPSKLPGVELNVDEVLG